MTISKRIVTDENMQPVAVQIDYDDWLAIEKQLDLEGADLSRTSSQSRKELAEAARPFWTEGDGLEYQRRIRAEWRDPWKEWSDEQEKRDT